MTNFNRNTIFAYLLVALQFACIAYFLFMESLRHDGIIFQIMEGMALLLGIISVICMRFGNLRISPIPKNNALMVRSGPYRWIRHPMYASVLLFCAARMLSSENTLSVLIFIFLLLILLIKMRFEERLLDAKFKMYSDYAAETKRIIPFIY